MKDLTTSRLRISPLDPEQLRAEIALAEDEHEKQALTEMLEGCLQHPGKYQWYTNWQITLKESGEKIGGLGFKGDAKNGEVEIGYGLLEAYQGMGYATEAVRAAVNWAFSGSGVYFVTAETEPDNVKSKRVLEKLGFKEYGVGEEGPRFEKEKPETSWMAIFLCLGTGVGVSFGSAFSDVSLGIPIGMCIGLALGAALDASEKSKRAQLKKARMGKEDGSNMADPT